MLCIESEGAVLPFFDSAHIPAGFALCWPSSAPYTCRSSELVQSRERIGLFCWRLSSNIFYIAKTDRCTGLNIFWRDMSQVCFTQQEVQRESMAPNLWSAYAFSQS